MEDYYRKYLKYKSKYLELKLIGWTKCNYTYNNNEYIPVNTTVIHKYIEKKVEKVEHLMAHNGTNMFKKIDNNIIGNNIINLDRKKLKLYCSCESHLINENLNLKCRYCGHPAIKEN